MSYRIEIEPVNHHTKTAICHCDKDWNPIPGSSSILEVDPPETALHEKVIEDVRLFAIGGRVAFCGTNRERMCRGWFWGGDDAPEYQWEMNEPIPQKNWTMYEKPGNPNPQFYKWPFDGDGVPVSCPDWDYGNPRGGTPLIRFHQWHVGFFHSHSLWPGELPPPKHYAVLNARYPRIYFGSPYARDGDAILFPRHPLIWPKMYGRAMRAPNNHMTVFPCGIVFENDKWLVSYGDDSSCWLAEFSTAEIFEVLEPI